MIHNPPITDARRHVSKLARALLDTPLPVSSGMDGREKLDTKLHRFGKHAKTRMARIHYMEQGPGSRQEDDDGLVLRARSDGEIELDAISNRERAESLKNLAPILRQLADPAAPLDKDTMTLLLRVQEFVRLTLHQGLMASRRHRPKEPEPPRHTAPPAEKSDPETQRNDLELFIACFEAESGTKVPESPLDTGITESPKQHRNTLADALSGFAEKYNGVVQQEAHKKPSRKLSTMALQNGLQKLDAQLDALIEAVEKAEYSQDNDGPQRRRTAGEKHHSR